MNMEEFKKVEALSYEEYCDYLQTKYGKPTKPYFTEGYSKNRISRATSEGLFVHHVKEDTAIQLSHIDYAKQFPYEYQLPENLVYCDYLEHLLLHVKICVKCRPDILKALEERRGGKSKSQKPLMVPGMGGIVNYLLPILNDIYAGYESPQVWQQVCALKVKSDKNVYIEILKYIWRNLKDYPLFDKKMFFSSNNQNNAYWNESDVMKHNKSLYEEISKALDIKIQVRHNRITGFSL